ncbi:MAG: hypothetical protein WA609_12190 [Terriglobales bacterium]
MTNRVKKSIDENPGASPQTVVEAFGEFLTRFPEVAMTAEELETFVSPGPAPTAAAPSIMDAMAREERTRADDDKFLASLGIKPLGA